LTYVTGLVRERWSRVITCDRLPCIDRPASLKLLIGKWVICPDLDIIAVRCCEDKFPLISRIVGCLGSSALPPWFGSRVEGGVVQRWGAHLFLRVYR
jgi:hypothetical protein